MSENKNLMKSFYATYSVGFITFFLISSYMIYTPVILDLLQISKEELGFAVTFFGIFVIISNLLSSRFLVPKLGTTTCLKISRIIISFVPLPVFYFETYFFLIFSYTIFGIGMGIQVPCVLTQVTIIENKTKKILTPIFKTSWAFGTIGAAALSSISLGYHFNPLYYFLVLGLIAIFAILLLQIYGLEKKYDVPNNEPKFSLPTPKTFLYGSINMLQTASMGIIMVWSSVWLLEDLNSSLFLAGSIVFFFNVGAIISNLIASFLIRVSSELFVGPFFSIFGSIILFLCTMTMNVYVIFIGIALFGFLSSNLMPIIIRQSIKMSSQPIPITISHVTSLGQSGFVFGPAIVGYSAQVNGLTFNVYAFCFVFFLISILMAFLMKQNKMVGVEGIEPTPPK